MRSALYMMCIKLKRSEVHWVSLVLQYNKKSTIRPKLYSSHNPDHDRHKIDPDQGVGNCWNRNKIFSKRSGKTGNTNIHLFNERNRYESKTQAPIIGKVIRAEAWKFAIWLINVISQEKSELWKKTFKMEEAINNIPKWKPIHCGQELQWIHFFPFLVWWDLATAKRNCKYTIHYHSYIFILAVNRL